ncbi:MAG: hypothetical protein WD773_09445 [Gemmatimonadales bacterium]
MIDVRHRCLAVPLLLGSLLIGCDQRDPLAPSFALVNTPASLSASAVSHNQIDLTWQDNSSNESGFEVHRSITGPSGAYTLRATTGANITSYSDAGVDPSTQYCYKVRAFRTTGGNTSYSAFSTTACATTFAPPLPPVNAPSEMAVVPLTSEHISVSWIDNSDNEDGFRVERSAASTGPWTFVSTFGPNATSFTLGGLATEQQVCYRALAFNAQGTSAFSNVDCTTPPAWPSGLTAIGVTGPAIDLAWTDNSATEDGYEVQRAAPDEPWAAVADVPANSTAYRDAGVIADKTYYYKVRAKKDGGYSYSSDFASAASASAPPTAPANANAAPSSSTTIQVNWVDNSTNEDGFRVERSTDGGASWVHVGMTGGWGGPVADSARVSEVQVCYRVIAFNGQGDSPSSNVDCTAPPAGPTNLVLIAVDEYTVELTWTDNSAVEDGYHVLIGDFGREVIAQLPANSTSYRATDTNSYWYLYLGFDVVAAKDGGYSDFSNRAWP